LEGQAEGNRGPILRAFGDGGDCGHVHRSGCAQRIAADEKGWGRRFAEFEIGEVHLRSAGLGVLASRTQAELLASPA
jgi:hypothetical protein